ncbi:MAG: hypothetical protein HXL57_01585 [Solobacterium sp.]|nr:hypothetical protein [Solobacterium sp.]
MVQQVSLSQVLSSVSDEFKFSEFESYDSILDVELELELVDAALKELF